jgi:signal transduction histidine kinase
MHVYLVDKSGRVIYSNLDPTCRDCITACQATSEITTKCGLRGRRRRGLIGSDFGHAYVCTDDPNLVASSKLFRKVLMLYAAMLGTFADIRQKMEGEAKKNSQRLLHNVTTLNAHILQELYTLVPQESLLRGVRQQIDEIGRRVTEQTRNAAFAYLKVLKNATAMKNEFSVVDRLWSGAAAQQLQLRPHNLYRVVMNSAAVFFLEFHEKNVKLEVDRTQGDFTVLLDYEAFTVALYHLFHNAVKYSSHDSTIEIRFSRTDTTFSTVMDMTSLHIYPHERSRIFEPEYSGEIPRKLGKEGSGFGLGIARELTRLHGGDLLVNPGTVQSGIGGVAYSTNVFEIRLPLNAKAASLASAAGSRQRQSQQ